METPLFCEGLPHHLRKKPDLSPIGYLARSATFEAVIFEVLLYYQGGTQRFETLNDMFYVFALFQKIMPAG